MGDLQPMFMVRILLSETPPNMPHHCIGCMSHPYGNVDEQLERRGRLGVNKKSLGTSNNPFVPLYCRSEALIGWST
jgi:hypothetical protein